MTHTSIYGHYKDILYQISTELERRMLLHAETEKEKTGEDAYEHLIFRVKTEESMREKCARKGLPFSAKSALVDIKDAIGFRVVTNFRDDIYKNIEYISSWPDCRIINEKDYIKQAKPNGYRSYHLILEIEWPVEDVLGNNPGLFYAEVQLRTIAMDSWASLEHTMKYKHNIKNQSLITSELKRVADELASCDISMQTIRDLIRESE